MNAHQRRIAKRKLIARAARTEIDSAYRTLRSKHHPDKGGDADQFQRIQRAYEAATK